MLDIMKYVNDIRESESNGVDISLVTHYRDITNVQELHLKSLNKLLFKVIGKSLVSFSNTILIK